MACCDSQDFVAIKDELILDFKDEKEDYYDENTFSTCFKCELCATTFTSELSLKSHSKKCSTKGTITCTVCDKNFTSNIELAVHILTHKNAYRFKCKYCAKMFSALSEIQNHVAKTHRNKKKRTFECGTCNGRYQSEHMLRRHETVKHGVLHRCFVCNEVFQTGRLLKTHTKKVHR